MLPQNLLQLACQEFATFEEAIAASPYSGSDIIFYRDREWVVWQVPSNSTRQIQLRRLSSSKWGWIPNHPEDRAVVEQCKTLRTVQFSRLKKLVFMMQEVANEDSCTSQALAITPLCQRMLEEISKLEGFNDASTATEQR
jgi:hypothetical protein